MRFYIQTFGCRVNFAESTRLALELQSFGFKSVSLKQAQVLIINSCAVTQKAVREVRQFVNQAKKANPKVKIWLTGCSATLWYKNHQSITNLDRLIPNSEKNLLAGLLHKSIKPINTEKNLAWGKFLSSGRLLVKVQDGCNYFCTYCIVPYLRGLSVSKEPKEIINYLNSVAKKLIVNEVVLSGINLGLYQTAQKQDFVYLIDQVLAKTKVPKLSFGSLYTENLTQDFLNLYNSPYSNRLSRFFHIPIQSGSDKILKLMRRRYSIKEFSQRVNELAKAVPNAMLATDVIVGFLEETEADFQQTYQYLEHSPFVRAHIFKYSKRKFTSGFYLAKKLKEPSAQVKQQRSLLLHRLFVQKLKRFQQLQLGKKTQALVINSNSKLSMAMLANGLTVQIDAANLAVSFVNVKIEKVSQGKLYASLAA